MTKTDLPGAFEHPVLLALLPLGRRAYGLTRRQESEHRTGRHVSLGAAYASNGSRRRAMRSTAAVGDVPRRRARRFSKSGQRRAGAEHARGLDAMRADLFAQPPPRANG